MKSGTPDSVSRYGFYCPKKRTDSVLKELVRLKLGEVVLDDHGQVGIYRLAKEEKDHRQWFENVLSLKAYEKSENR
jgi:hypothetical protein